MSDIILAARGITRVYKSGAKNLCAVDGVNLEVNKGASVAVIGPSGAGKSTLLHLLGGLDRPTAGQVLIGGVDLYRLSDARRAKVRNTRVGFVFQAYHLLSEFTALENVMLPAMIRKAKAKEIATELLKLVGLEDRMHHRPGKLSGGESQRVAIARALMNSPEILLCDEPTGNLDSETSESIYGLLFGIRSKTGMSLVIVTHDDALSGRTDSVLRMKDGRIVL